MSARGGPDFVRYLRPIGWATLAAAPILLAALAVAAGRPSAPASLVGHAAWAAWIAAALAFEAAVMHQLGSVGVARGVAGAAALVVVLFCAFLVWLSRETGPERGERAPAPLDGAQPVGASPSSRARRRNASTLPSGPASFESQRSTT